MHIVFFCLKICFTFTNSVDPDEMQLKILVWRCPDCKGLYNINKEDFLTKSFFFIKSVLK